jgi:hypothetical protein
VRDDLDNLIDAAAYVVYRRHRSHTDPADIRQEMWVWVLAQDATRVDELEPHKLTWKLRDAGEVYARKEKAAKGGYVDSDEVFYSMRTLRDLLPLAITTEPVTLRAEGDEGGSRSGEALSMEFETTLADVRRAFRKVSSKYREVLALSVTDPLGVDDAAVTRALRFMQRKLGGRKPRKETV